MKRGLWTDPSNAHWRRDCGVWGRIARATEGRVMFVGCGTAKNSRGLCLGDSTAPGLGCTERERETRAPLRPPDHSVMISVSGTRGWEKKDLKHDQVGIIRCLCGAGNGCAELGSDKDLR